MVKPRVKFSGTDSGLLMRLEWDAPLPQLLVELEEHLQQSRSFFEGAHVLLEVGQSVLKHDMEQLAVAGTLWRHVAGVIAGADSRDRLPLWRRRRCCRLRLIHR
jgi:hypothetical protein